MYGTLACYNGSVTASAENAINAVADPDFTIQSNNFAFTSPYLLLGTSLHGASVQYGRYITPQWAIQGYPRIYAANRAATPGSNPIWDYFRDKQLQIPQEQQVQFDITNNLSTGNEKEAVVFQVGTPQWSMNAPAGQWDVILHATCAIVNVAGSWVENNAITFDQPPLGGVYLVLGTQVIGASAYAYRWVFPRSPNYMGRRLRPGGLVQTAFGNLPAWGNWDAFRQWGVQGGFWTYEQPTLGTLGQTSGSVTYDVFMYCRFLGQSTSLLDQFVGSQQ